MDLSTSITTNISSRNTTHLSTNKPTILSTGQPTTTGQMLKTRNELDGLHRRCMPNPLEGQGRCLLSATPTTKQVTCWSLKMGTDLRNTTTYDKTLGVQQRTTHGTKDDQWGSPKEKRTTWANHWTKCYRDGCWQHKEEKTKNHHYPRRPVPGEKVVRGWGKDARTRPWGEGSEKTQPDIEAYQRQIQELLEERDRNRKTIADLETTIGNQRRTVTSSAFMLGRAENEVRILRRAVEKYEVLRSDVSRAGRKLLDLGN